MYICDYCSRDIGPRVPLTLQTSPIEARPREYVYEKFDPETEERTTATSKGWEITAEYQICPACRGVEHKEPRVPDYSAQIALVKTMQAHAKVCGKHTLAECAKCQRNVEVYATISLPALTIALQQPVAQRMGRRAE